MRLSSSREPLTSAVMALGGVLRPATWITERSEAWAVVFTLIRSGLGHLHARGNDSGYMGTQITIAVYVGTVVCAKLIIDLLVDVMYM